MSIAEFKVTSHNEVQAELHNGDKFTLTLEGERIIIKKDPVEKEPIVEYRNCINIKIRPNNSIIIK
jgi:hypothetical protein